MCEDIKQIKVHMKRPAENLLIIRKTTFNVFSHENLFDSFLLLLSSNIINLLIISFEMEYTCYKLMRNQSLHLVGLNMQSEFRGILWIYKNLTKRTG